MLQKPQHPYSYTNTHNAVVFSFPKINLCYDATPAPHEYERQKMLKPRKAPNANTLSKLH